MNRRTFFQSTLSAAFGHLSLVPRLWSQPETLLKAGFAETDITPDIGMEQPGGYGKVFHKTFHDPCKVRAAVFDDGRKAVALVGIDSLAISRRLVLEVRRRIREAHGIGEDAVLIGASHSHSSGPLAMVEPRQYDHAPPQVQKLAYEQSSMEDPGYAQRVAQQLVRAVGLAYESRQPARCAAGFGVEDKVAFNRRIRMRNGRTFTHPGKSNPESLGYAGPVDPQVGVLAAWDTRDRLLGCLVHYSCHATTSPGGISANWIYYLEKVIRGGMDAHVPVVFLANPNGDVTQVDNLNPEANPEAEEWARLVGGRVGAEAVKVMLAMYPGPFGPVDARQKVLQINRRAPGRARVQRAWELVQQGPEKAGRTEWTFAKETLMLDALLAKWPVAEVEVQAVQVGPAVFLANPAEYFVEFALDIKKRSPFPFTFPVQLANGCVGYVPTEEALSETGGGYETRLTSYSNLEVTAGRKIADACVELAGLLKPGAVPKRPLAPPGKPWDYGNVPAEVY